MYLKMTMSSAKLAAILSRGDELTHFGLVTPYDDINLVQHWLRSWLAAWRHQAITWTNVDLSLVRSSGIHLSAILQEIPQPSVTEISLKIYISKILFKSPRGQWVKHSVILFPFSDLLPESVPVGQVVSGPQDVVLWCGAIPLLCHDRIGPSGLSHGGILLQGEYHVLKCFQETSIYISGSGHGDTAVLLPALLLNDSKPR